MKPMTHKLALVSTAAIVAWGIAQIVSDELRHGTRSRKHQMQTWEGEGGNLNPSEQAQVAPPAGAGPVDTTAS